MTTAYPDDNVIVILGGDGHRILIFTSDGSGAGKLKLLRTADRMVREKIIEQKEYLLLAVRLFSATQDDGKL